jgi:Anti-sigma factor NepR
MPAASTSPARPSEQQIDAISASLRRAYSDAVAEDVPDALMDLLNKLR